jgi:hypothetical protein
MNNNVILIQESQSKLAETIAEHFNPSQKTILQFTLYDKLFISRKYTKNIVFPRIPYIEYIDFPKAYSLVSKVCVTNDVAQNILNQNHIDSLKLDFIVSYNQNKIKLNRVFDNYYKFGAILNFNQDIHIIEDLVCVFYEAARFRNTILVLAIESTEEQKVLDFIENLHKKIGIAPSSTKVILSISGNITDDYRISVINSIDCLLQINAVFISDIEYYYALQSHKRIIGKYNLDKRYNIETISTNKRIFKFQKCNNFYDHIDHDSLLKKLSCIDKATNIHYTMSTKLDLGSLYE